MDGIQNTSEGQGVWSYGVIRQTAPRDSSIAIHLYLWDWLADIKIDLVYMMHVDVHHLDTTLQKSLLFPLVTKMQDGFLAEMNLSASSIHVESPNHYSLAHTSADNCHWTIILLLPRLELMQW